MTTANKTLAYEKSESLNASLNQFETYVEKVRNSWNVPGIAIAAVAKDEIIYQRGFGVKQYGSHDPVDPHTLFQIGSTTKAFTSALVAKLVDAGYLQWGDRVIDHLPNFTTSDPWVTQAFLVRDLMAQHSGFEHHATDDLTFVGFDRVHVINSLKYLQPVTSFRSSYAYVNNLFIVAAALVEKYTGKTWEQALTQQIFEPLHMQESSATKDGFFTAANRTGLHVQLDGKMVILDKDWPFHQWLYTAGPAGSINSNVLNMAQWLRLQLGHGTFEGKEIVSAGNLQFTRTPQTVYMAGENLSPHPLGGIGAFYAEGWVYAYAEPAPIVWHTGGTSGCATVVAFVPTANVGVVVLTNLSGTMVPEILAQKFFDLYFGALERDWNQIGLDKKQQAIAKQTAAAKIPPSHPSPPALPLSNYTGTYSNKIYGNVTIAVQSNKLIATIGPNQVKVNLLHWDRDTFRWCYEAGWGPDSHESLTSFEIQDGKVTNLIVEFFKAEGAGIFKRSLGDNVKSSV